MADPKLSAAAKKAIKAGGVKRVVQKNTAGQNAGIKKVSAPSDTVYPPGVQK